MIGMLSRMLRCVPPRRGVSHTFERGIPSPSIKHASIKSGARHGFSETCGLLWKRASPHLPYAGAIEIQARGNQRGASLPSGCLATVLVTPLLFRMAWAVKTKAF